MLTTASVIPPGKFWLCFWNLRHLNIYHKPITSDKLCYFHILSACCGIKSSRQHQLYHLPNLITTIWNNKYLSISQNMRFLIEMLPIFPHSSCSCFLTWHHIITAIFQPIWHSVIVFLTSLSYSSIRFIRFILPLKWEWSVRELCDPSRDTFVLTLCILRHYLGRSLFLSKMLP